mgnify:CR=1 FL=1
MKRYTITVNGNAYDVTVDEADGSAAPVAAAPAPKKAAPAKKAAAPAGAEREDHQCREEKGYKLFHFVYLRFFNFSLSSVGMTHLCGIMFRLFCKFLIFV